MQGFEKLFLRSGVDCTKASTFQLPLLMDPLQ